MWMHLILCFFCLYSWELYIYWKEISTNVIFLLISPLWKQGEVRCRRTLREKFSNIFIWPTMHLSNPFFNESWADGFLSDIAQTFHLRIRLDISVEQAFSFFFSPFFFPCKNSSTSCFQLDRKYQRNSPPWSILVHLFPFLPETEQNTEHKN